MSDKKLDARIAEQAFVPVLVGAHVGAYSVARAFHEEYGVTSYVISGASTWVTRYSTILRFVRCADALDPDTLVRTLTSAPIADMKVPILLIGTSDSLVETIVAIRDRLPENVVAPYPSQQAMDIATRKHTFAEVAERAGVTIPRTMILDLAGEEWVEPEGVADLGFPMIVKATSPTAWRQASFEGKAKVHVATSLADLRDLVARIHAGGYRDQLVLQDRIPGDDTGMRILTCYCDRDSRVRMASWGETLIEEHSPGSLGVPAAILTGTNPEMVEQACHLLAELNWVGYANFDLKYDPRDGSIRFFELNPRLGRSNYYVTGAGQNPARWYVEEYLHDALPKEFTLQQEQEETVYSIVPRRTLRWALQSHPGLRDRVVSVLKRGGERNPLYYKGERDPRRFGLVALGVQNYDRKFHRYYDPIAAAMPRGGGQ